MILPQELRRFEPDLTLAGRLFAEARKAEVDGLAVKAVGLRDKAEAIFNRIDTIVDHERNSGRQSSLPGLRKEGT